MTAEEEAVAYVILDAVADLTRIEARIGHAGPAFEDAALIRAAAARHLPLATFEELVARGGLFSSPRHALQTLVGLGLEGQLS